MQRRHRRSIGAFASTCRAETGVRSGPGVASSTSRPGVDALKQRRHSALFIHEAELTTRLEAETIPLPMPSNDSPVPIHTFHNAPCPSPDAHPSPPPAAYRSGGFAGVRAAEVLPGRGAQRPGRLLEQIKPPAFPRPHSPRLCNGPRSPCHRPCLRPQAPNMRELPALVPGCDCCFKRRRWIQ